MWQSVLSWRSEGQGWSPAKVIAKGPCLRMKEASQLQTCTSYFKWWPDTASQRAAGKLKRHHQGTEKESQPGVCISCKCGARTSLPGWWLGRRSLLLHTGKLGPQPCCFTIHDVTGAQKNSSRMPTWLFLDKYPSPPLPVCWSSGNLRSLVTKCRQVVSLRS